MNLYKLKEAEQRFLELYPGGFDHPEIQKIAKKHKLDLRVKFCQEQFAVEKFEFPEEIVKNMALIISRSSMVSVFEKPKFKDFTNSLNSEEKAELADSLKEFLHGDEQTGFENMSTILDTAKLAKWTLITIIPNYFEPKYHVYIKPTTVKGIISYLEIEDIKYKPKPTYEFYVRYRKYINEMKKHVDDSLCGSNAGFSGFLMMMV